MENIIFTNKTVEEARRFYYITKGVHTSKLEILYNKKVELNELLKQTYSDKSEIKILKEQIKKLKIEIETIEFLYKCAFD